MEGHGVFPHGFVRQGEAGRANRRPLGLIPVAFTVFNPPLR